MDPKKKKTLNNAHQAFMDLMLKDFPLERMSEYIAGDVMGFGTTLHEKLFGLEALADIIRLQREQGQGLQMRWEIEPVHRWVAGHENNAVFVDEVKLLMTLEDNEIELNLRLTLVFDYLQGTWKIIHWHGSKPEYDEGGTDTWHLDEWKKKNDELQRLVDEKTADLERKNRELEIEAALERVRAIAMSMQKPDDLADVCQTISEQLEAFNVKNIRNVQLAIINEEQRNYANYQYFAAYSKQVFEEPMYGANPSADGMVSAMQESANSFFIGSIRGEELKEFIEWRKKDDQFPDPLLEKAGVVYYYFYSIGKGGLGLTTYKEISNESLEVFKRFHKVFTLAYQRYKDIQQALEQAREAQIEAALERVRAKSLSMHSSNELSNVASVLFEQMRILGGDLFAFGIVLCDKEKNEVEQWHSIGEEGMMSPFRIPVDLDYIHQYRYNQWKAGAALFSIEIPEDYIDKHFKLMFEIPSFKDSMNDVAEKGINITTPGWEIDYGASFSHGYLLVSSLSPFKEDYIFPRFAKAFEQAYIRFLDLQKAEAQAREAQIEASLERVRAHAMGLRRSEELNTIISIIFEELNKLGLPVFECSIFIRHGESRDFTCWNLSESARTAKGYHFPFFDHPILDKVLDAIDRKVPLHQFIIDNKELRGYCELMFEHTDFRVAPKEYKDSVVSLEKLHVAQAIMNHGFLEVIGTEPLSEELTGILMRFTRVVDLTYTRYLDIQEAETRAQEARIETALERVRSRSMGMQKSDELNEVIHVIYDQFVQLGMDVDHTGIIVDYEKRDDMLIWLADQNGPLTKISIPYFDSPHWNSFVEAKKTGKDFFANQLDFETKNGFYKKLFKFIPELPEESKRFYLECPGLAISTVLLDNVGLYIENFSGRPYSDEENKILMRFGKVFQQSYTRFLDLEKAEAQARGARIEAALERVRSRSMGMQKSEELADLSLELVRQVQALGVETWFCAFNIYDDHPDGSMEWGSNGQGTFPKYRTPREGVFLRYYEAGQKGEKLLINEIGENECPAHYEYLCSLPGVGEQLLKMKDAGIPFPTSQIDHVAYFKFGYIIFITFEPEPEAHEIFIRFAHVFEQTYTRFLDLQKAELQAREAQIEASLEKVRRCGTQPYRNQMKCFR
ncbi:MAG: nuclear transport factor 2 family protein [Bacteroidales bacterium]